MCENNGRITSAYNAKSVEGLRFSDKVLRFHNSDSRRLFPQHSDYNILKVLSFDLKTALDSITNLLPFSRDKTRKQLLMAVLKGPRRRCRRTSRPIRSFRL